MLKGSNTPVPVTALRVEVTRADELDARPQVSRLQPSSGTASGRA